MLLQLTQILSSTNVLAGDLWGVDREGVEFVRRAVDPPTCAELITCPRGLLARSRNLRVRRSNPDIGLLRLCGSSGTDVLIYHLRCT